MRRLLLTLGATAAMLAASTDDVYAGWPEMKQGWHSFWDRVELDFHRMNCWPEPFQHADRQAYAAPFAIMIDNGWRLQNTISDELFDAHTNQLSYAGELKVRWIVTEAPPERRVVFVLRGMTPDATAVRLDSVQQAIARVLPAGPMPEVLLTDVAPRKGNGAYFDQINRGLQDTVPAPRLPSMVEESGD